MLLLWLAASARAQPLRLPAGRLGSQCHPDLGGDQGAQVSAVRLQRGVSQTHPVVWHVERAPAAPTCAAPRPAGVALLTPPVRRPLERRTTLAISGDDFVVVAVDTRLSEGYGILSRDVSRSVVLTPRCVLATGGCHTDVSTLHKVIDMKAKK